MARDQDDATPVSSSSSPLASYTTTSRKPTPRNRGKLEESCTRCNKKVTLTNKTRSVNFGQGLLCMSCTKSSGANPFTDQLSLWKPSTKRTGASKSKDASKAEIGFIEVSDEDAASNSQAVMPDQRKRSFEDEEDMDVEEGRASVKKARTAEEDTSRTDNDVAIVIDVDELATGTFVSDANFSGDLKAIKVEEGKGKHRAESPSTENEDRIQLKQRKELESELEILEEKHTKLQESLAKSEKLVARLAEKKKFLIEAVALSRKTCTISQAKRSSLEEEVRRLKQDTDNLTSELDQSKQENARVCEENVKLREELRQATLQTSSSDSEQKFDQGGKRSPVIIAEHTESKKLHGNTQARHLTPPTDTVTDVQDQTSNNQATNTEKLEASYSATRTVSDLWSHTQPTSDSKFVTSIESAISVLNGLKKRVFEDDNTISKLTNDLEALNAMKTEQDTQLKQLSIERDKAVEEAASSRQRYTALRLTLINLGNG